MMKCLQLVICLYRILIFNSNQAILTTLWFFLSLTLVSQASAESSGVIAVITSADNTKAIKTKVNELDLIYWRKKLYDADSKPLHPVNLNAEHPLRQQFSQAVLKSTPKAQIDYWNGLYFHGVMPPRTLQSEEAVIRYVADTANAIAYIDACHIDDRVQTVMWLVQGVPTTDLDHKLNCH